MSQEFFEKYKNEIARIINVLMSLFTLLIGFNIGSGSRDQETKILNMQLKELNEFIEVLNKSHYDEKSLYDLKCKQDINNAILYEIKNKEQMIKEYKSICKEFNEMK
jgi:hypothetical protein